MKHVLFLLYGQREEIAGPEPAEPPLVLTKSDDRSLGRRGRCRGRRLRRRRGLRGARSEGRTAPECWFSTASTEAARPRSAAACSTPAAARTSKSEAGVTDDADEMFRYLSLEVKGVVSEETLRDFCDKSVENLSWLEGHGVPFEASLCPYKTSYPTDDYYLYYSGNEGFSPYKDAAKPAPRGHRAKGAGLPGESFYEPLRESRTAPVHQGRVRNTRHSPRHRQPKPSPRCRVPANRKGLVEPALPTAQPSRHRHRQVHPKIGREASRALLPNRSRALGASSASAP